MSNTIVCEETGIQSINGSCPTHGGDACLVDVSAFRRVQHERMMLYVLSKELMRLSGLDKNQIANMAQPGCVHACYEACEVLEE